MKRSLKLIHEPIDEALLQAQREVGAASGAVLSFSGWVRDMEGEARIAAIDYEGYEKMAYHQFDLLLDQMEKQWPIESIRLVHRLGKVAVNEPSLWVEVVAPHRLEAFEALMWLIDSMKQKVPIWKLPIEGPITGLGASHESSESP